MDNWDRKTKFNCDSCRYYVPKPNYGINLGACRKNAPTMTGYPVVNAELDWCGEHKIGSNPVRDRKTKPLTKIVVSPEEMLIKEKTDLEGILNVHREYIEKEVAEIIRVNDLHREAIAEEREKTKIKAEIGESIDIICNDYLSNTDIPKINVERYKIRELLEKL